MGFAEPTILFPRSPGAAAAPRDWPVSCPARM